MKKFETLKRGMGIGGWLTNYKRFNVLPKERRLDITIGDLEHFDTYITRSDVEYIASLGMDHIRLGFDQIVIEESPYVYRERIIEILKDFVGWCDEFGLTVILNMHKALGNYCDILEEKGLLHSPDLQDRFIAVWLKLDEVFTGRDDIIFELLNEVVNSTAEEWNALARRAVAAIREKNTERPIILGTIEWNRPMGLSDLEVFDDENIIYTFHCYAPDEFTHQRGVLQAAPLYYNRKMQWPSDDVERYRDFHRVVFGVEDAYPGVSRMDVEFLRDYCKGALEFKKRHPDKLLWCGEFGTIRHADIKSRENWMRDMITILKEWDIPYCVWNYLSTPNDGNRFSLVDDDTRRILSPELERVIKGEF